MNTQAAVVEVLIEAPASMVWKAITDPEEMKKWYFTIEKLELQPGFSFQFTGGDDNKKWLHICQVQEVEPYKKLSYIWQFENCSGTSLVTFNLTDVCRKTSVKLTHEGLESFTELGPDFSKDSFATGWNHMIGTALKEYVESQPYFWSGERLIDAPPSRVWEMMIAHDLVVEWSMAYDQEIHLESTWEKGSLLEWKSLTGETRLKGYIKEIEPYKHLKTIVTSPGIVPDNFEPYNETFDLTEKDGKVLYSLRAGPYETKLYYLLAPFWEESFALMKDAGERKN